MALNPHPWLLDLKEIYFDYLSHIVQAGTMLNPVAQRDLYPDERLLFLRRSGKSRFILLKGMKPNFSRVKPKAAP